MNIALCFSGQVRDFENTIRSFRKHILRPLRHHNVYLFCHAPATGRSPEEFGLHFSDVYWEENEPSTFNFLRDYLSSHDVEARPWNQIDPLTGYVRQLRSIYLAHKLQHDFGVKHSIRFDMVFRLRFDNLYVQSVESLAELNRYAIFVPGHDSWGGINDRFAFGPPALMDFYCNRFLFLESYLKEEVFIHPETLLALHLSTHGVPVMNSRVVHHLYRHDTLKRAVFKVENGDDPSFSPSQPGMRYRFQIKQRLGDNLYYRLALFWWKYFS